MQLDLSTLSTPELRRLLDSARRTGQAAQSYRILQEMAVRRESEPEPRAKKARKRRPDEPRVISIDFGDPLEPRDVFAEDDLDVPPMPRVEAPNDGGDDPISGLTLARAPQPEALPSSAPRKRGPRLAVFAAGATMGVVAGWVGATATASNFALPQLALPELALSGLTIPDLAAFVGASTPAAEPAPDIQVAELPPAPTGEAASPAVLEVVAAPVDAMALAQDAAAQAPVAEPVAEPTPVVAVPPPPPPPQESACDSEPTAADRLICEDPALQKLQRDLRQAYARALDAHADRATLRQRQLAWRDARDAVEDPEELASVYEARIRKLNMATAEARRLASR